MTHETAIIVLNWNNARASLECLASLQGLHDPAQIILVDNGSTDDSVAQIRQRFPQVTLLETHENLGYAGGNNFGIRFALDQGAQYLCILNNDVQVAPDFLSPLIQALGSSDVGIATPLVAEADAPEKVWALGQMVDWKTGNVTRPSAGESVVSMQKCPPVPVDVASGTAMVVKPEVMERAGLMDEDFFLYYEETDWCLRVRQAGYKILGVPESVVWHAVSGTLGQTSPVIDYYMLRNHLRFISRHWQGIARWKILFVTIAEALRVIAVYTVKPWDGKRLPHRNARLLALRDAALGRWGKMGNDVAAVCSLCRL